MLNRYHEIAPLFERLVRLPTRGRRAVDFADISGTPVAEVDTVTDGRHLADVCFFGISPRERSLRDRLHLMAADHAGLYVITLANEGAEASGAGEIVRQPAFPVAEVVDTTGAGDCFAAHFLACWCATNSIGEALAAGCLAASHVIQRRGAS